MGIRHLNKLFAVAVMVGMLFSSITASPDTTRATSLPIPSLGIAATSDTIFLTDEPGNWFRSALTGTPLTILEVGGEVKFEIGSQTDTKHTVTLLMRPTGSSLEVDQADSIRGGTSASFDVPGVYLFTCKVHPYMQGIVAIRDAQGNIPPVTRQQLPFIGYLGVDSLPASTVVSVLTSVAPTDSDKRAKWDIFSAADQFKPSVPGIGEVWVDTQFELVPGQASDSGVAKPGSITVVDAATFTIKREINGLDPEARGRWNNPHNMWADARLSVVYNGNWFGKWLNKIDRATGNVLESITLGEAPTHIVSNPNEASSQYGWMTTPLSAEDELLKLVDQGGVKTVDQSSTGTPHTHPHGHWDTSDGTKVVVPNVFKGLGVAGSISIMDLQTGTVLKEISYQPTGLASALLLPVATGIKGSSKAYVSNIGSGQVSVIDLAKMSLAKNIPVTFTPDGRQGAQFTVFDTLQAPIQPPVSPDGRFVGVAVLSLTNVKRAPTGSADHVAIIDTTTDTVTKFIPVPAGAHGAHWGAKDAGGTQKGGYYLYVTHQNSNVLTVIDPDPNSDGMAHDAAVVGRILLADGSAGAGVTDGTGGQGLKPMPNVYDGWIQDTVALSGTGQLSAEVEGWIRVLAPNQKNPGR